MSSRTVHTLNRSDYAKLLPKRARDAHKYSHGNVCVIGGSVEYPGAVILAVRAAARSGSGYVRSVVPSPIVPLVQLSSINTVTSGVTADEGMFATSSIQEIFDHLSACDVVVLGPGMGRSRGVDVVVSEVLRACKKPVIVDADALYTVAKIPAIVIERTAPTVLTPHRREAERLARGLDLELSDKKVEGSAQLADAFNCTIVAKGPNSVVADRSASTICPIATPALATAGTGDVLSGILGALVANTGIQGAAPVNGDTLTPLVGAVSLGIYVHAVAGELAARQKGEFSVIAQDVISMLPAVFKGLRQ